MKFSFILLFAFLFYSLAAQRIIINGEEGYRPLKWSDFTGSVDNSSPYWAHTQWATRYHYDGVQLDGDSIRVKGFEFTLLLDPQLSWVKNDKQNDELLKHEQGHFDIGVLYQKDVLQQMATAHFSRTNYMEQIKSLVMNAVEKYKIMGEKYDNETDHSKNKEAQTKWNAFFEKELK